MSRPRLPFAAAALVVLFAAGCGSDDADDTSTGGTTDPTTQDSMTEDSMTEDSMTEDSMSEDPMTEDPMTEDSMTDETMVDDGMADGAMAGIQVIDTGYGPALGDGEGYVLYTWDEEVAGAVECVDAECTDAWPPHLTDEVAVSSDVDADLFSLVERPDGAMQLAVDGRPLYRMAVDTPGEVNCQGGDGWWIVRPDGSKNTDTTPV